MPYRIRIQRHYYQGTCISSPGAVWVCDLTGRPFIFQRREDAEKWIEEEEANNRSLRPGEYAPPTYHIRRVPSDVK